MLQLRRDRLQGELTLPLPQTVMDILEYLNEKKLQELKRELEEWEEKEESKMKCKNPWRGFLDSPPWLRAGQQGIHLAPTFWKPVGAASPLVGRWNC